MGIGLSSFLQSQPNIFIYQRLGWRFAFYYTVVLGGLYFFFNRKDKWKIKKSIQSVFSGRKNHSERKSITLAVFRGIILHYYEKLFNAFSSAETLQAFFKIHMKNDGLTAIEEGLSNGNGVLLVTGHFGGVEFIPGYLAANNLPVTIIVRFKSKLLRDISIQKAKKFSARIIDVDNTPNIMILGKDIHLDRTMDILIRRVNPAIVFGLMHREADHRYLFIATSRSEMIKNQLRPEEMPISRIALSFLEQYIYKYPREWYQWKQYADMVAAPPLDLQAENPASLSLLKTSLDNIS
jgi:lauroyl/myristoyl acyltransferase